MRQQLLETQRNLIESQIAGSEGIEQGFTLIFISYFRDQINFNFLFCKDALEF